ITKGSPSVPLPDPGPAAVAKIPEPEVHSIAPTAPSARRETTPGTSLLAAERALLDKARSEVGAGDATAAMQYVSEHARRFPAGRLREEREALAINALVSLGRFDEARDRAELFRQSYPQSFLWPSIEAALAVER